MLRAVLVDLHHTLVRTGSVDTWVDAAVAASGDEPADRQAVLTSLRHVWSRAAVRHPDLAWDLDPALHRRAFEESLREDSSTSAPLSAALYDLMLAHWMASDGAVDLLVALRRHGLRVGLLSNIGLDPRGRLAQLGLLEHLDDVVLSVEVGLVKPDPRVFALAARRLGVEAADCVMLGDSRSTDGGAAAAGMTTVLVPVDDGRPRLGAAARMLLAAAAPDPLSTS
ncbi:HAD family hydrolase [Phycicoccus sp. MAQZ13P-2]|uniref:HAD family hydrolase n=1 Tax=Phycicoccus mangrovi TaxID=2840470 RepID=UPI001BFFFADA|nr:HAD family hydrolase [Phycicoccus mangrovi]MBT9256142.1 HAD family hydrolase [Phycicoccus mangrovi]MBT9273843.1 HAD family hydrolase [Phycicoccus mangrovi]